MTYCVIGEPPFEGAVHTIEILVWVVPEAVGAFGLSGAVANITPTAVLSGPSPAALTALI